MKSVIVIGGGLSGLVCAIDLARMGVESTLIEKKTYPFHRVCGEYVSNEVLPFLESVNLVPDIFPGLPKITRFQLTSAAGRSAVSPLDLGGFGISRFALDHYFYQQALKAGVRVLTNVAVTNVQFRENRFSVEVPGQELEADVVVGAYGKRSKLDVLLDRGFVARSSPFLGIKYHARTDFPDDLVALHNFNGGYCGVSRVENGITNICYLAHRTPFRKAGSIAAFEDRHLFKNPWLREIFSHADFVFEKPLTINEISFATKSPIDNHVLMTGDAAGMITPLCGNGMAIAIRSATLASRAIRRFVKDPSFTRRDLEAAYANDWRRNFAFRLSYGRQVQRLFGNSTSSALAVNLALYVKPLSRLLIKQSHGSPF